MSDSKYVLLKFNSSKTHSMPVRGALVVTRQYWNRRHPEIKAIDRPITMGLGTNNELNWDNGALLLNDIAVQNLSLDETKVFMNAFPVTCYWREQETMFDEFDVNVHVVAAFGQTGFLDNYLA